MINEWNSDLFCAFIYVSNFSCLITIKPVVIMVGMFHVKSVPLCPDLNRVSRKNELTLYPTARPKYTMHNVQ